jgi:hypothetical protein
LDISKTTSKDSDSGLQMNLFREVGKFSTKSARSNALASLDPVPKCIFDFGSINGCQNSLHLSKKLPIERRENK